MIPGLWWEEEDRGDAGNPKIELRFADSRPLGWILRNGWPIPGDTWDGSYVFLQPIGGEIGPYRSVSEAKVEVEKYLAEKGRTKELMDRLEVCKEMQSRGVPWMWDGDYLQTLDPMRSCELGSVTVDLGRGGYKIMAGGFYYQPEDRSLYGAGPFSSKPEAKEYLEAHLRKRGLDQDLLEKYATH